MNQLMLRNHFEGHKPWMKADAKMEYDVRENLPPIRRHATRKTAIDLCDDTQDPFRNAAAIDLTSSPENKSEAKSEIKQE